MIPENYSSYRPLGGAASDADYGQRLEIRGFAVSGPPLQ